jgi:hypothetical protein
VAETYIYTSSLLKHVFRALLSLVFCLVCRCDVKRRALCLYIYSAHGDLLVRIFVSSFVPSPPPASSSSFVVLAARVFNLI